MAWSRNDATGREGDPHIGIYVTTPLHVGGVFQSTLGLIHALGKLEDGRERYTIVAQTQDSAEWLRPYCGRNQRVVVHDLSKRGEAPQGDGLSTISVVKRILSPVLPAMRQLRHLLSTPREWTDIPVSDGYLERLGCDLVHFPSVWFALCNLPSIYNPHDLQHLRYPRHFTLPDLTLREVLMPAGCRFAHTVVVGTQWVKDDVARRYRIDPDKIQIIPWAALTEIYKEPTVTSVEAVRKKHGIEGPFAIYPAATYPYKNHIRLLDALAELRDRRGLIIQLVCTGAFIKWHWPRIEARVKELNLESQVKFLGFVPDTDLRALYRLAQFLVMPTLYEADSNPIHEAWHEGVPVASSNVTALPDQVKDAGILFDPQDSGAIADAIARLATSEPLRENLRQRGYRRIDDFSWERTARAYRAVYRRAMEIPLTEEERWLLQWDWLRDPERRFAPEHDTRTRRI